MNGWKWISLFSCIIGCVLKTVYPNGHKLILSCVTVPGNPQDVTATALNSTTIRVEWKPPRVNDQNGVIRGYHVHIQEVAEEVSIIIISKVNLWISSPNLLLITSILLKFNFKIKLAILEPPSYLVTIKKKKKKTHL